MAPECVALIDELARGGGMRTGRFAVLVLACALPWAARADTPQDFSGEWVIAGKDSQPQGSSGATSPGSHHGGGGHGGGMGSGMGGGGGGGHGMGGGRHRSTGAPEGSHPANGGTASGDPRLTAQALAIRQSDVVFDVAADGGTRMVYRFDNRNNYGPAYGGTVTLTWAAPEMVIETHPDGGGSIEEHYTLSDDGKKLSLRIHEQHAGSDTPQEVTRVFVRQGSEDAATASKLP
jgi:hypothetical protein